MIKGKKYRYTLQFGMASAEECRAGEVMEALGNRKSRIVVAALNEYLDNHPELLTGGHQIQFQLKTIPQEQLEECVRRIVEEHLKSNPNTSAPSQSDPVTPTEVSDDILGMLGALDLFN